jgi:PRC-barrel domain
MLQADDVREWRGHDVPGSGGHQIGMLESVYVDTGTGQPAFATVTVGLSARRLSAGLRVVGRPGYGPTCV